MGMISCCYRYMECSKEGKCINPLDELRKECNYRVKLESGINFYYKPQKKSDKTFIVIENRLLYISKRSSYGSWSYRLSDSEREELKSQLTNESIQVIDYIEKSKCIDEIGSEEDPAYCKVILTLGKGKYNIHNYNIRGFTENTAIQLRDSLRSHGLLSAVEYVGSKSMYKSNVNIPKRTNQIEKTKQEIKHTVALTINQPVQISIFDILQN
ncbi:hypothetical protein [Tepidibacter sp. Z1-5]|uniref:hypothetical protein n=1 Tax=Tepidibacter sp. Z1-5 TaxID=3134138 RepID=UPI0030C55C98